MAGIFPNTVAAASLHSEDSAKIKEIKFAEAVEIQEVAVSDPRVTALRKFLEFYKSPLAPYAEIFVREADEHNLPDWRLVPAIAGVESTFGKRIPYRSYNAYGWANGGYQFQSWEDSIDVVSKALSEKYYGRGANTVQKIARIYCPPSSTWAGNVTFFMNKLQSFYEREKLNENLDLALAL